ncbi:MAG: DUF4249 family protein [Bacteroidetes bacterium]|nr:DUF4249 family protein [Bacteroidota bacterium]
MRKILHNIILTIMISGCVKETVWTPPDSPQTNLVVDAIITDEVKSHKIYLTTPVSQLNQSPKPYTGASVLISNEDSTWQLTENPADPGCYQTPSWFSAKLQKNYSLVIARNDQVYTAKATMLPSKPFPELKYLKNDGNNLYYVDWVANAFTTGEAAMWELLIDWSLVPGYEQLDSLHNHARLLFYTLPTLDVSEVFAPRMETTFFPAGANITERRYSLTPAHAEFIREALLETNWTGGLFTVAPANVTTNMSNGALGFFGACGVYELSIIVTR